MVKSQAEIEQFYKYLEDKDYESISLKLPKLLKSFLKLNNRFTRILKQSDNQQLEMLKLKEKIEDSHKQISLLLNNAGQGFLYFDKDMKIGEQYSKEVKRIFTQDVAHKNITKLLYEDESDAIFLETTLQDILKTDQFRQEILISLLQKEFFINNIYVELEYKVLDDNRFMLIMTDITAKKELAQKIKDEQQILKMVVETVTLLDQFRSIKKDYEEFILNIDNYKNLNRLADLRKEIHTFKGLFAQKEMVHIVKKLHNFESLIDKSLKNSTIDQDILSITTQDMKSWLDLDMKIMINILGEDFFKQSNYLNIDKDKLEEIYERIVFYIDHKKDDDIVDIAKDILTLQYSSILTLLKPYIKLVEQLSVKLDKYINPLVLECEDIYIPDNFKPFINSLVHIFRNSVDHGIETLEDRYENGKDEYGTIKCIVKEDSDNIYINISDDGVGIDEDKIKALALKKKIYTQDEIDRLSRQEVVLIIFKDTFTTNNSVTDISGRGVGLASVMDELKKLDGDIKVNNHFGKGVEFIFTIPKD